MGGQTKYLPRYESEDLDFEATYAKLSDPLLTDRYGARLNHAGQDKDSEGGVDAGSLQFMLYPTQLKILISPKGPRNMVQVFSWMNEKEKETYLPMLQTVLVPVSGKETVTLHPVSMGIAGTILYPGPAKFILPWCKEKTTFFNSIFVARGLIHARAKILLTIILTVCSCGLCLSIYSFYLVLGIGPFAALWPDGYAVIASVAMLTSTFIWISLKERTRRKMVESFQK